MYLRRKKAKAGYVLQLLDSYRNHEGKPRHRVILSLGNASIPKSDWSVIAKGVEQRLRGQDVLFPEEVSDSVRGWIESIVKRIDTKTHEPSSQIVLPRGTTIPELKIENNDTIDGVLVNEINHSHTTRLGPELLGIHAYECLKIDDVLIQNGFNHAQRQVARASIINRLVDPVAEKALPSWVQFSSLPDLCGEDLFTASKDRYYRVSDKLLEHQKEMESHLRKRQRQLFNLSRTIFLYDLTNSHFEGKSEKNPKARYGKNKQKRDDCPQVVVGLILDGDGFPMAHKMFEGNQADAKTLVEMVKEMQQSIPEGEEPLFNNKPIVIVDAGVATKYNLQNLREAGFHYLVNDSRRGRKRYLEQFQQEERFETICGRDGKSPVRVAKFIDPDVTVDNSTTITDENAIDTCASERAQDIECLVLCKSESRGDKEKAMLSQAEKRYIEGLKKLAVRLEKGLLVDEKKINQALGRLQSRHGRIKKYYEVKIEKRSPSVTEKENTSSEVSSEETSSPKTTQKRKNRSTEKPRTLYRLTWNRRDKDYASAEALMGCYVLRTDLLNISAEELWKLYMTLTQAEEAFHALKQTLGLRPIFHQLETRVDGHVWITILAYNLLRFIQFTLETHRDYRSWKTIKRVLSTHCYTTIAVPTKDGHIHRIRKAGIPEMCQQEIYQVFGIEYRSLPCTRSTVVRSSITNG